MSMHELDNARHAEARGKIIKVLAEDFIREMTSVGSIVGALDALQCSLTLESLALHLMYLAQQRYVKLWRNRDMDNFRRDRMSSLSPDTIRFARLLPLGLQLVDGECPADPKVRF